MIMQSHDRLKALQVNNLKVSFHTPKGRIQAVRDISFSLGIGECLCLVGESGSGKSVSAQAVMGILPMPPARIDGGEALLDGKDLIAMSHRERRNFLGKQISMIFQDPLASLNPTMTVHDQIAEMLIAHASLNRRERHAKVVELARLVGIPEPERQLRRYPHEFSGGMRQRMMIGMALACNPRILIADEPTSALDASIQAQILALLKQLANRLHMSTIFITHDLGVVAQMADRVAVMYAGKIVEEGSVDDIFYAPKHPYSSALLRSMPKRGIREPLEYIAGTPPDLLMPPPGCAFAARCPSAMKICRLSDPEEIQFAGGRVSCWIHNDLAKQRRRFAGIAEVSERAGDSQ
jgi:oligopeptide transport system ATP-binding protein